MRARFGQAGSGVAGPFHGLRGSDTARVVSLVVMLLLVLAAMQQVRRPENWHWMFAGQEETPASATIVPANRTDAGESFPGVDPRQLKHVRDDTVHVAEDGSWFQLCHVLQGADRSALEARAIRGLSYTQLAAQPAAYRGHLVHLRGKVLQSKWITAPTNGHLIDGYWQLWVQLTEKSPAPVVVYALGVAGDVPAAPPAAGIDRRELEVAGFYYKRWAYAGQDHVYTAPVILAKEPRWLDSPLPPVPGPRTGPNRWLWGGAALLSGLAIAGLLWRSGGRSIRGVLLVSVWLLMAGRTAVAESVGTSTAPTDLRWPGVWESLGIRADRWGEARAQGRSVASDRSLIDKVLYYWPRLPWQLQQRYRTEFSTAQLLSDPESFQGEAFLVRGTLARWSAMSPLATPAERDANRRSDDGPFVAELLTEPDQVFIRVYTNELPFTWLKSTGEPERLGEEPISFVGTFVDRSPNGAEAGGTDRAGLEFVAPRIAWYPQRPEARLGVSEDHVDLARRGFDFGLWDRVQDRQPLTAADRDGFYQLLKVMGHTDGTAVNGHRSPQATPLDVGAVLTDPNQFRGKRLTVTGTARRALKIVVPDPDIRAATGIDAYYEIEVFVHLPQPIRFVTEETGTNGAREKWFNRYPVVCCVRQVPPDMPLGDWIRQPVRISGYFWKIWAYPSLYMSESTAADGAPGPGPAASSAPLQISPLLLGLEPELLATAAAAKRAPGRLPKSLVTLLWLLLAILAWIVIRHWVKVSARRAALGRRTPTTERFSGE